MEINMAEVIRLYEGGMTQEEIGKKLGTTQKVIYMRLKKIGYKSRVAKKRNQFGVNNPCWKGNKATYAALHYRVEKIRGKPHICEQCGITTAKRYEWANMTGKYDDPKDYKRMCKKCHHKQDIKSFKRQENGTFKKLRGEC